MRVRVKICGLTDEAGLEAACAAGADAVGFVLAPSPRRVTQERARALLRLVPPGVERVAVLGRASAEELSQALALEVDAIEAELDSAWPPLPPSVFALPVLRDGPDVAARAATLAVVASRTDSLRGACVLDGAGGGGRGEPVDVERARALAAARPIVLAGGLTPANVAARLARVLPFAVSVSSGVERVRGTKDPGLVHAFVRAARSFERASVETTFAPENP
jgi:phosphoribosylanthranilate isomerase